MSEYWESLTAWKKMKLVLTVILSIFVLIFAIVNWQESNVNFVFFTLNISVTLLIVVCLCVGYLVSTLFESKHYNEKLREIKALQLEIDRLNEVIAGKEEESKENPDAPNAEEAPENII